MSVEATQSAIAVFVSSPAGQWMSVAGWLFGVVGTTVGVAAYVDQRRQKAAYAYILEDAKRRWHGEYAAAQVQQLETELERLKDAMTHGIPVEARRAVAGSQMVQLQKSIVGDWQRYSALKDMVETESEPLPEEIRAAIESQLVPREQTRSRQVMTLSWLVGAVLAVLVLQMLLSAGGNPVRLLQFLMRSLGMYAPAGQLLSYLIGVLFVSILSGDWFLPAINDVVRRRPAMAAAGSVAALFGWVATAYWLTTAYEYPVSEQWHSAFEVGVSIVTLVLLWAGLRLGRPLFGRRTI